MKYTVSLAHTDAERGEAFGLLKKVYLGKFKLDLEGFNSVFPLAFASDVFVIYDQAGQLVGTASVMFPQGDLFPSEYIFGTTLRHGAPGLPLRQSVEIGRLAKSEGITNGLIIRAVMLAVATYLQQRNLAGWFATVKPPLYQILQKTGLDTLLFENYIESTDEKQREAVRQYKGDKIISFWADTPSTCKVFEVFQSEEIAVNLTPQGVFL